MPDDTNPLDLIGSSEAATIVGVHVATIARWAADGTLPVAARLAGKTNPLLFHRADVERVAAEKAQAPARDAGHAAPQLLARAVLLLVLAGLASLMAFNAPAGTPLALLLAAGAWYVLVRLLGAGAFAVGRHQRAGGAR